VPLGLGLKEAGHEIYFATHEPVFSKIKKLNFVKDSPIFEIEKEIEFVQDSEELVISKTVSQSILKLKKFPKMMKTHEKIIKSIKPDLIISDTVVSAVFAAENDKIDSYYMTNQTNTSVFFPGRQYFILRKAVEKVIKRVLKYSKIILIPDFPSPYTFCESNIDYFGMEKKFFFSGPILNKRPEYVKEKKFKRKVFLVISGGTRAGLKNYKIFKKIGEEVNVDFIIMNSERDNFYNNVKYLRFVNDIYPFIKGSFSIISHGGHTTLMECATYGKPIIALSTKEMIERENNLYGLEKNGMGIKIKNMKELEYAVKEIIFNKKYVKKAKMFKSLSKNYDGIKKVNKLIESQ